MSQDSDRKRIRSESFSASLSSKRSQKVQYIDDVESRSSFFQPSSRHSGSRATSQSSGRSTSSNTRQVASHYNAKPQRSINERKNSPIAQLKFFNNWIKSVMINDYVASKPHAAVLDLCCGKGGDLRKWTLARIGHLIGCDISEVSIEDCKMRYKDIYPPSFPAAFYAIDAFSADCLSVLDRNVQFSFDAVSCQFALHYAGESEKKLSQALKNISAKLRSKGYVLITLPSHAEILFRLFESLKSKKHTSHVDFGNEFYKVSFDMKEVKKLNSNPDSLSSPEELLMTPSLGVKYVFSLEDAIDDCPEYLIPMDILCRIADTHGLDCIYEASFLDHYNAKKDDYASLLVKMGVYDQMHRQITLSPQEWEIAAIYSTIIFRKR